MIRILLALAAALSWSSASARDVKMYGFTIPETIEVEGATLRLNGAGVRQAFYPVIGAQGVYVGALYLTAPASDPAAILAADAPWVVRSYQIRDVDQGTTLAAIRRGFEANSKEKVKELQPLLERLAPAIPDMKSGQVIVYAYRPGKGVTTGREGGTQVTVEGKALADALLRNWIGPDPADPDLKRAMLGSR